MSTTTIGSLIAPASGLPTTGLLKPSLGNVYADLTPTANVSYSPSNPIKLVPVSSNSAFRVDSNGNIFFTAKGVYKVTAWLQATGTSTTGSVYTRCYNTTINRCYGQNVASTASVPSIYSCLSFEVNVTDLTVGIYFDLVSSTATLTNVQFSSGSITQLYSQ